FICDNPLTPFALQSDQSTNINGICQPNVQCRCMRNPQCPEYIQTLFSTINGNPYTSINTQRVAFVQSNTFTDLSGTASTQTPIIYQNPATSFCTIPLAWTNRSQPGCGFASDMNATTITQCMNSPASQNPCLVVAFISDAK